MTLGAAPGIARRRGTAGTLLLAACFGLCGCLGTIATREHAFPPLKQETRQRDAGTRSRKEHANWGAVPFSGVAFDVVFVFKDPDKLCLMCLKQPSQAAKVLAILSLPLDALFDAFSSPGDLVAWAFGYSKTWPFDEAEILRARESWEVKEP